MGTSGCSACGADLPGDARFCPRCGTPVAGGVPVLDLGREQPAAAATDPDPEPPDRSVATAVGVVVALIAAIVLLSLLTGRGSDDEGGAGAGQVPTTAPAGGAGRTTLPRTVEVQPLLAPGERLDPAFGMGAVRIQSNGTVVVADLASGAEQVVADRIPVVPVSFGAWVGETFVVYGLRGELHRLAVGGSGAWEPIDTGSLTVDRSWPGPPGVVYLWDDSHPRVAVPDRFGILRADGPVEVYDGPGRVFLAPPVGLVSDRLVFNLPDGIFLLGADGTIERYGWGVVLGTADRWLVRRACDETLSCRLVFDDLTDRSQVDLGPIDAGARLGQAVPHPEGTAVAVVAESVDADDAIAYVRILPTDGSPPLTFEMGSAAPQLAGLQWSADGDGLIWLDPDRRQVRSVRWRNGSISIEPESVNLSSRRVEPGFYEGLFVVPLSSLPPDWRPG